MVLHLRWHAQALSRLHPPLRVQEQPAEGPVLQCRSMALSLWPGVPQKRLRFAAAEITLAFYLQLSRLQ